MYAELSFYHKAEAVIGVTLLGARRGSGPGRNDKVLNRQVSWRAWKLVFLFIKYSGLSATLFLYYVTTVSGLTLPRHVTPLCLGGRCHRFSRFRSSSDPAVPMRCERKSKRPNQAVLCDCCTMAAAVQNNCPFCFHKEELLMLLSICEKLVFRPCHLCIIVVTFYLHRLASFLFLLQLLPFSFLCSTLAQHELRGTRRR